MAQTKVKLISDGVIVQGNLHASHGITTAHIGEGSNLYYTDARVGSYLSTNSFATESYVGTQIANLVDSSPSTLNTLNELAAALGDDANFSTTVTNSIALKAPIASPSFTGNAAFAGTIQSDDITIVDGINDVNLYLANTSYGIQLDYSAGDMFFRTNNATRLTIANGGNATFAGNVNISKNGAVLRVTDGNITNTSFNTLVFAAPAQNKFALGVSSTTGFAQNITIDGATANVGIGTTSPSAKLEIKATGATTGLTFRTTDSSNNETFYINDLSLIHI